MRGKLSKGMERLVKEEKLALPVLQWDAGSQDADEKLAMIRLTFLIAMYEPQYYWFEVFVMVHKLMIISVLPAFVPDDGAITFLLVAFVVEFAQVILTSRLKPWSDPQLDRLNLCTSVTVCIVLFTGIATKVKPERFEDPDEQGVMGVLLILLNLLVLFSGPLLFAAERTAQLIETKAKFNVLAKTGALKVQRSVSSVRRIRPNQIAETNK